MARKQQTPASEMVIDQPGAAPAAPEAAEFQQRAVSIFATAPTWEPHPTMVEIAKLKEEKLKLIASVATKEGLKACKEARRELVQLRVTVDNRRKEEGRLAYAYKKTVDQIGGAVIAKLQEIEDPLDAAIKAEEQKAVDAALAKARAIEEEQRKAEEARLAAIREEEAKLKAAEEARLQAERDRLAAERKELEEQRAAMAKRQEEDRLEQQRKIDLERAEFEKKRQEFERQQAELRAEQEKQRLENERTQREAQAKLDKERRDREEKERQAANAKRLEEEKKKSAEKAIADERARVAREAEANRIKEEKAQAAAAKKAAQAPDKVKLKNYVAAIVAADVCPPLSSEEAKSLLHEFRRSLAIQVGAIEDFVEGK